MGTKNVFMVLSIAGSDCSGGAGIQADLKTISSLGVFAATAITAITSQNTLGVKDVLPLEGRLIKGQIEAVLSDLPIGAVKLGMLHDKEVCRQVNESLRECNYQGSIVADPVMVATSGNSLSNQSLVEAFKEYIFPIADIITPNLHEAAVLSGIEKIETKEQMRNAAETLLSFGARAVLLKGGHLQGGQLTDVLLCRKNGNLVWREYTNEKINSNNTHGTGCSLSSATAAHLALGYGLEEAVKLSIEYIHSAILASQNLFLGHGHGAINHFFDPKKLIIYENNCQ